MGLEEVRRERNDRVSVSVPAINNGEPEGVPVMESPGEFCFFCGIGK